VGRELSVFLVQNFILKPRTIIFRTSRIASVLKSKYKHFILFLKPSELSTDKTIGKDPVQLPAGYYLDNFMILLKYLEEQYTDILSGKEKTYIRVFQSLLPDAQRLYVRLIMRRGPAFIKERIHYKEISDPERALDTLVTAGWMQVNPILGCEHWQSVFTVADLYTIIRDCGMEPADFPGRKNEITLRMVQELDAKKIECAIHKNWTIIHPGHRETIARFMLLFFGNTHQGLSDFILEDIGVLRYEPYKIAPSDRFISDRSQWLDLYQLYLIRDQLQLAMEQDQTDEVRRMHALMEKTEWHPSLEDKRNLMREHLGRYYEKKKLEDMAMECYERSGTEFSTERKIRILERKGQVLEAWELLEKWHMGKKVPDGFPEALRKRLAQKMGYAIPVRQKHAHPSQHLVLQKCDSMTIEQSVLEHFSGIGCGGFHAENQFWSGLFGLAFWDVIFSPQPGMFFNPFQRGPADLFEPAFRQRRKKLVDDRLKHLKDPQTWAECILGRYDQKQTTANHLVSWKHLRKCDIQSLLDRMNPNHLVSIFDRMASDLGHYTSGFPDLVLFDATDTQCILTEVKGPGDQLRSNQERWFQYFHRQGIPYQLVNVVWNT
jgi:hypothetical protein